jgi:hypothetical protein
LGYGKNIAYSGVKLTFDIVLVKKALASIFCVENFAIIKAMKDEFNVRVAA